MKSSSRFEKNKRGTTCLNCSFTISENDNFCPNCGQINDENRISLKQYFSQYLSGIFSFDNRFFKTVVPLIFKPAKVTREYIEGKRKKYVNPFQMYLHVTIIFFLIQGIFSTVDEYKVDKEKLDLKKSESEKIDNFSSLDSTGSALIESEILAKKDSLKDPRLKNLGSYIDSLFVRSAYLDQLNSPTLTKTEKDSVFKVMIEDLNNFSLNLLADKQGDIHGKWEDLDQLNIFKLYTISHIDSLFREKKIAYEIPDSYRDSFEDNFLKNLFGEKLFTKMNDFREFDKNNEDVEPVIALEKMGYDLTNRNIFLYSKAHNINRFIGDEAYRKEYLDNIISKISVALFFLLPLFTLFVALLYLGSRYNYTEHLVFVFHVQTAFFILLILTVILGRIFHYSLVVFFILVFLFYLYKALRNFYKQGRFVTWIKYIILNSIFSVLALIGGIIISFIAFLI